MRLVPALPNARPMLSAMLLALSYFTYLFRHSNAQERVRDRQSLDVERLWRTIVPRTSREERTEQYPCDRLHGTALVHLTYLIRQEPLVETLIQFDCEDCKACGVAARSSGLAWSFDWAKYVHPKSTRKSKLALLQFVERTQMSRWDALDETI